MNARLALPLIGFLNLALASCIVPPAQNTQQQSSSSSAVSSVMQASSAASSTARTGSAALIGERLLSGGILEIGAADAPTVLTVFVNHASAYSQRFLTEHLPRLRADFVQDGALRIQIIPLQLKKEPLSAAQAMHLLCATQQGKGEAMNEALVGFTVLPPTKAQLTALGIDQKLHQTCLASPDTKATLGAQQELAKRMDVTLVPTVFLNGEKRTGLAEYPDVRGWIRAEMAGE